MNEDFAKLEEQVVSLHELEDELDFVADQGGFLSMSTPSHEDVARDARDAASAIVKAIRNGIRRL